MVPEMIVEPSQTGATNCPASSRFSASASDSWQAGCQCVFVSALSGPCRRAPVCIMELDQEARSAEPRRSGDWLSVQDMHLFSHSYMYSSRADHGAGGISATADGSGCPASTPRDGRRILVTGRFGETKKGHRGDPLAFGLKIGLVGTRRR